MSDIVNIAISCCEDLLSKKWAPEDACERIENAINAGIRAQQDVADAEISKLLNQLYDANLALAARTEECARVADRYRDRTEQRSELHTSEKAKDAALDTMEAAIEIAAAIRALPSPSVQDTINQEGG